MENGEANRQMNFALSSLAEITIKLGALTDSQTHTDTMVAGLAGYVQTFAGNVQSLAEHVQGIVRQQFHLNDVIAVMAESQRHTDQRLNTLIDIVRNGRNGQSMT